MAMEDIRERLAQLPRRAVVAFAARCARRVQPLAHALPQQHRGAIARAIAIAEAFAQGIAAWAADAADAAWAADAADAWAAAEAAWAAANAARAAEAAAWAADAADLDRLIALNLGRPGTPGAPIDPSESGPLGPLWPQGVPEWFPKADIIPTTDTLEFQENLQVEATPQPAPQVFAYFDGSGFTPEEVALCLSYLSEVYHDLGGAGLKVVGTGQTLVPEGVRVKP
ncbi:MAG: hypothetical protein JOZ53_09200 [Planctomycetaceae bacterium]|nr:hypothetical protein [Planctomycetaceae bacterium]